MPIALFVLPLLLGQDGLKITDVTVGAGKKAVAGDYLKMDYTGTLTNGKEFDSSTKPGRKPFGFMLGAGQVIKGWDKGVVGMKVGGKRVLTIPPELGYGAQGAGADIPPNATLKFVIELRKIFSSDDIHRDVSKEGHGAAIKMGDSVTLNIIFGVKGGKKLFSTYDQGKPITFQLGNPRMQAPPGLTLALVGMKEGEKCTVNLAQELALGDGPPPPGVTPGGDFTLTIDVMQVNH